MSATAVAPRRRAVRPPAPAAVASVAGWAGPALAAALAAALRLPGLGSVRVDPFYDAAVRSMGGSWHAFLTGAIDPSGQVAVDKPPVDLWLQVASTRALGFTPFALHLPEALGGVLAVLALYDLLHTLFGRAPALAGALALAVLPVAVITARSDTMDSVMAALVVAAAALTARAARDGRPWLLVAAGATLGLAFEVKLFEALAAAPALAALWWFAAPGSRRGRARALAGAGGAVLAVGLAWLSALTVLVPTPHPWAFGSSDGSAWNATFVYDGIARLTGSARPHGHPSAAALARVPAAPGPLRLFSPQAHLDARMGVALAAALGVLLAVALARAPRGLDRAGRAGWWVLAGWLLGGAALFSAQPGLKSRYLEVLDPALAAVLGAGVVLLARRLRRPAAGVAVLALLLAAPAAASVAAVAAHAEDAGAPGSLSPARTAVLGAYLRAHQGGARYEAAAMAVGRGASLIARDGRPVLLLTADGRALVGPAALARAVAAGEVRYAVADAARVPVNRWIHAHGHDVSAAAGQPPHTLYALR